MLVKDLKKLTDAYTHAGTFHADDVFSAAFLKMLNPKIRVHRVLVVPKDAALVFDIGYGKFDHHQPNNETRPNGIPYAAFGKLWREFGTQVYGLEITEAMDKEFVQKIDAHDTLNRPCEYSVLINDFLPAWCSDETVDSAFWPAVRFATKILENRIKKCTTNQKANDYILSIYNRSPRKDIIVLDRYVPYKMLTYKPDTKFLILPSPRGGFAAIALADENNVIRCPFPENWRGKQGGHGLPEGTTYCHNSGFMLCGNSVELLQEICERFC